MKYEYDTPTDDYIAMMDNVWLVEEARRLDAIIEPLKLLRRQITYRLQRDMDGSGAVTQLMPDNTVGALRQKRPAKYDKTRLEAILEIVPEEVAVDRGALTLATKKTVEVPRDWNMTKTKTLKEFGNGVTEIIEGAKFIDAYKEVAIIPRKEANQ